MKPKLLGMKIILVIFAVLAVIDITLAYMLGNITPYLETNPLYILSGTLLPIIFVNVLLFLVIWWAYKRTQPFTRFFLCSFVIWQGVIRGYAINNAIRLLQNPPSIETLQALTTTTLSTASKTAYFTSIALSVLAAIVFTCIVYVIWRQDHKVEVMEAKKD